MLANFRDGSAPLESRPRPLSRSDLSCRVRWNIGQTQAPHKRTRQYANYVVWSAHAFLQLATAGGHASAHHSTSAARKKI